MSVSSAVDAMNAILLANWRLLAKASPDFDQGYKNRGMTNEQLSIGATSVRPNAESTLLADKPWVTVVWDDPINLMSYVAYVFSTYFGYDHAKAETLMMQVHMEGKAAVSSGVREAMERDVQAMHQYGLWATLDRGA